ncbi:MAG: hypothetical protein BRD52_05785 [Bacteroidetes bacterium SW_4_67_19]|nr:MAG: hypothetical protein BRD52_05785 [Bacteroidetes bacterium SW_4_67_19]
MKSLPALSPAVLATVLAAVLALAGPPAAVHAQTTAPAALDGTWHGTLDTGGQQLTVVFHLKRKGEGDALTATMDVPQQSVSGVSVSDVRATGDSLRLEVAQIGGVFKGTRTTDGPIDGTWRQSDRPQTPEPPFPYEREDATFRNADAGVTLAGTLTTPEGEGPHPAVVLVSGSGPQNRNGVVAGHETLHVLADALTRRGIAVLRYDERGVGESTGSFSGATTEDFAGDVRAALDWLRQREGLGKIGVVGWSEGALVAPMLAARSSALPDFLVLMGAPGVPGKQILLKQRALIAEAQGAPPASLDSIRAAQERLLSAAAQAPDSAAAAAQVRRLLRARQTDAQTIDKQIQQYTDPWFRQFMRHDPRPALRQTDAPVLALYGEHDFQVPPAQNADPLRKALSGNPDATVEVLPGLNHLFQPADTGLPSEYGQIEATIAPKALDAIAGWIAERTRAGGE